MNCCGIFEIFWDFSEVLCSLIGYFRRSCSDPAVLSDVVRFQEIFFMDLGELLWDLRDFFGILWRFLQSDWSFLESIAGFFRIFFTNLILLGLLRILEGFLAACFRIFFKLSRFFYQRSWGFSRGIFQDSCADLFIVQKCRVILQDSLGMPCRFSLPSLKVPRDSLGFFSETSRFVGGI